MKVLVFQHVAWEILGTLDPLLRSYGGRIRYANFGRSPDACPSLDGYRGLIVLGGPMNVDEVARHPHLATELRLIGEAIERGLPVLGVCLGAQLIARALGARVGRAPEKEIGWTDVALTEEGTRDPLFRHFGATERLFQWHGCTFDLPDGAVHLARSRACANQAFRFGDRTYGLQFHLEVDQPLIERWLCVPEHRDELASCNGVAQPDVIRAETRTRIAAMRDLADLTFTRFAELMGARRRRPHYPHR